MCVYICVHMCVCIFVFICVCECLANSCVVFLSECICVLPCPGAIMISYVRVHVCSYVHVCVHVNICIHTYVPEEINIHMYMCAFICSCLHSHKCMCGHMYITMFICACVSCVCACSHVHMNVFAFICSYCFPICRLPIRQSGIWPLMSLLGWESRLLSASVPHLDVKWGQ